MSDYQTVINWCQHVMTHGSTGFHSTRSMNNVSHVAQQDVRVRAFVTNYPPLSMIQEVAQLYCPNSYGFEGPETFSDCGTCIVCQCRAVLSGEQ